MNAPAPLLDRDGDDVVLTDLGCRQVAELVNLCIEHDITDGVEVEMLSPYDLEAGADAPEHTPGHRHFRITIDPTAKCPHTLVILLSAAEPDSDRLLLSQENLLAVVSRIESLLSEANGVADDLAEAGKRRTILTQVNCGEAAKVLSRVVQVSNYACDEVRFAAAEPGSWQKIGPKAVLYGVLFAFGKDGE